MAVALKDEISQKNINHLGQLLQLHCEHVLSNASLFDSEQFEQCLFDKAWNEMGLLQRLEKVARSINESLHVNYAQQLSVLMAVEKEFDGLFHLVFAEFVRQFGLHDFPSSIKAMAVFTENSSSEFAMRPFLQADAERMLPVIEKWSQSDNFHLRRLASESIRPRLPWAPHLSILVENPDWGKTIIENLKCDTSRYVQKSIANLLNDLTKSHPNWVLNLLEQWSLTLVDNEHNRWIIKHALRSLLKQGNSRALALIGYVPPNHIDIESLEIDRQVKIGDKCHFHFTLSSPKEIGLIRVEYAIYFLRKTQSAYRKVFKVSESIVADNIKNVKSSHDFKVISTRKYQVGKHQIDFIINGVVKATGEFELQ